MAITYPPVNVPVVDRQGCVSREWRDWFAQLVPAGGAAPAPADGPYVLAGPDGDLPAGRVLTAGTGISLTDGGAGGALTVATTGSIPTPSNTVAALDGTGDAGVATTYSRGDHRHEDVNRPTTNEKAALVGTEGTPSGANPYVTDSDPRLSGHAEATATFLTETDETATLINSRRVLAGTGITFDDTVAGERTINATGLGDGYWTVLTDGDVSAPELIFALGDVISVFVPT